MCARVKTERRRHPRLEQKLPVSIVANGYDFSTVTQNISCVGAYCHISKYIPPFTKVAVKMCLPLVNRTVEKEAQVECKGVVVRTEDATTGGFNVAIFFNEIKESQQHKISSYIKQFLPYDTVPSPQ